MFLLKEAVFINFGIFISFPYSFYFVSFFFSLTVYKKIQILCYLRRGYVYSRGYGYFLPNVPGAMFIQGATSILDSKSMQCMQ